MKIPYIVVIGDKEEKENKIALRIRGDNKIITKNLDEFISSLKEEIKQRK
jgi:threonyl-tRNA synthetase